jgi:hypothetical protein
LIEQRIGRELQRMYRRLAFLQSPYAELTVADVCASQPRMMLRMARRVEILPDDFTNAETRPKHSDKADMVQSIVVICNLEQSPQFISV